MDFRDLVSTQRVPLLEKEHYGYWKVNMKAIIQGIDEDAWTAIEDGYETPKLTERDGSIVIKPKSKWTKNEKHLSMCNAKALSTIFASVNRTQFKLIQGCSSAKEAWEKLEKVFEGTSKVKTCRLDMLASKFERLKMEENETIEEFSSKISSIASEAQVLGKKYNDKKLVKKLFRSLHPKFESKKTAMQTALNTDQLDFDEAVGHFQAYEMEINPPKEQEPKELAFMPEERKEIHELKEVVNKLVKRIEAWNLAGNIEDRGMKHMKRDNRRCYVCQGVGHLKATCATVKKKEEIKCGVCKGFGHTDSECSNNHQKSCNDNIESESDDSDDDMATGYVSLPAIVEKESYSSSESDSDWEDNKEIQPTSKGEMFNLYESWMILGKEKLQMLQEKIDLEEENEQLKKQLMAEQEKHKVQQSLMEHNADLTKQLRDEQEKSKRLELEIAETMKKVQMLNSGTKDLEKILSMGRTEKGTYGLGYQGKMTTKNTNFIQFVCENKPEVVPTTVQKGEIERKTSYGCYYCGKDGHIKRYCAQLKEEVKKILEEGNGFPNRRRYNEVWVAKKKLYGLTSSQQCQRWRKNVQNNTRVVSNHHRICNQEDNARNKHRWMKHKF